VHYNSLILNPRPSEHWEKTDFYKNTCVDIAIRDIHHIFEMRLDSVVERFEVSDVLPKTVALKSLRDELKRVKDLGPNSPHHFLSPSPLIPFANEIADYVSDLKKAETTVLELVSAVNKRIYDDMDFDPNATTVDTPLLTAFQNKHGVCQDYSHIMIACLRSLGIPAAYVSGFLRTIPPEGKERLEGADAMHAWVRVWLGSEVGWKEFDPTNNLIVNHDHIVIGYGRDYSDVAPIKGVLRTEGSQGSSQSVDVTPAL
jgi:transglutaminase-like putative cysteine protease